MQKKPIKSLSVQPLETARHDYEGWETFAIRTEPGNVCVAIVGEVDNYHDTEYRELAYQMAAVKELLASCEEMAHILNSYAHAISNGPEVIGRALAAITKATPPTTQRSISLEEYTRQASRLHPGAVKLKEGEYTTGVSVFTPGRRDCATITQVFIPALGIGAEYVAKDGSGILYTTDEDGNPKNQSVFQIPPTQI